MEGSPMPRSSVAQRPPTPLSQAPYYPADLLPELQSALAALADLEVGYEIARERLRERTDSEAIRTRCAADLERRYRSEREQCDQRLAELHQRLMTVIAFQEICEIA
jgi:hypothetical protein